VIALAPAPTQALKDQVLRNGAVYSHQCAKVQNDGECLRRCAFAVACGPPRTFFFDDESNGQIVDPQV
jgi:hypothetical protein